MANPYYITLEFPTETLPAGSQKLTMVFTVNENGTDATVSASSVGLSIRSLGEIEIDAEPNELLLSPAVMKFDLYDSQRWLYNRIFDSSWLNLKKDAMVKLEIAGVTEFEGYLIINEIEWDEVEKTFYLSASPRTTKLNDTLLWDDNTALNPLSLTQYSKVSLTGLIEDIFQVIDPSLTVEFYQDWLFGGRFRDYNTRVKGKTFSDLLVSVDYFFFDVNNKFTNLADVLKQLCFDFGCYCGLKSNKKAFFRKLFTGDNSAYTLITDFDVMSLKKNIADVYKYVNITVDSGFNGVVETDYDIGDNSSLSDQFFEQRTTWYYGYTGLTFDVGTYWFIDGGDDYLVCDFALGETVVFPTGSVPASYPASTYAGVLVWEQLPDEHYGVLLGYYWKHRCTPRSTVRTTFKVTGTDYSIISKLKYKNDYYFVIGYTKDYVKNTTELKCVSIYDSN